MLPDGNSISVGDIQIAGNAQVQQITIAGKISAPVLVNNTGLGVKTFSMQSPHNLSSRTADDIATYILSKTGSMSAMKLQKLLYYSQAWSLVWDDRPLFPERIEAWANGPVLPALYEKHKGQFEIPLWPFGNLNTLDEKAKETVDAVLEYYEPHNAQWLSDLTHSERPWRDARIGLAEGERGNREITLESMMEYYSSLSKDNGKEAQL